MALWGQSPAGNRTYKALRQEQWSRNCGQGSVPEAERAGDRMTGNEASRGSSSCTILLTIVRTFGSILGAPGRHESFKICFLRL